MGWSWAAACGAYRGEAYRGGLSPTACLFCILYFEILFESILHSTNHAKVDSVHVGTTCACLFLFSWPTFPRDYSRLGLPEKNLWDLLLWDLYRLDALPVTSQHCQSTAGIYTRGTKLSPWEISRGQGAHDLDLMYSSPVRYRSRKFCRKSSSIFSVVFHKDIVSIALRAAVSVVLHLAVLLRIL